MNTLYAILLGILQGITEFLPVSSSGHLVLAQHLLGFAEAPILFDVVIHTGTLISVIFFFRLSLLSLSHRYIKYLIVGTIPVVIAGLFLKHLIEAFFQSLLVVSLGFLISAFLVYLTKFHTAHNQPLNAKRSFQIGCAQALALIPGISRSGSTISASLVSGLSREKAFEFSFLLSIPAILGALALQLSSVTNPRAILSSPYLAGFSAAALTGFIALALLKRLMVTGKLHYFSYYLVGVSVISFIIFINS
jgi:undecaprenyl-diphosphatase